MIIMKNFTVSKGDINGLPVSVATDETGADWYESQKSFQDDTLKIVFNSSGVIISMSRDVSALWPGENSVAEIAPTDVPTTVDINGEWVFDGKQITARIYTAEEWQAKAEDQRQNLLKNAASIMADWRTELQLGAISDDDKASLIKWMAYIKAVKVVDISAVKDEVGYNAIAWPSQPD